MGVQYSLNNIWNGSLVLDNKPGRIKKILEVVEQFRTARSNTGAVVAALSGLLSFAGGFTLGHRLKLATHALHRFLSNNHRGDYDRNTLCNLMRVVLTSSSPWLVQANDSFRPVVIYADGAYEGRVGNWGAVVLDPVHGSCKIYGGEVPPKLISVWTKLVGQQVIGEVEMHAYLCIRFSLRETLRGRSGITFIDNERVSFFFD